MVYDISQLLTYAWGGGGWQSAYSKMVAVQVGAVRDSATAKQFIENYIVSEGFNKFEAIQIYNLMSQLHQRQRVQSNRTSLYRNRSVLRRDRRGRRRFTQEVTTRDRFNVVGDFKMFDESGQYTIYSLGDVVYYEGNSYIATGRVTGYVPESTHPNNKWKPVDNPNKTIDGGDTF